ncbi:response regulator [Spirochaeta isovalerica]|uniref:CheY-like chemotaxis protein n=1 Tax=Spirochaeta isovalerica TaxID=150 RepID=A0A841RE54_9SPIO|nr:response regulator [Spirochaeta isovalerica]MBB6481280.1 CheY-like chemotaxis protein [Spirochaeta isovalerica]
MKKILIADDHFEIRELLKDTLEGENREIHFAENGRTAVRMAREEQPEIIIMDIMMPGRINGLEATQQIKADELSKNSKIIILSAKGKDKDKINALEAGASAYIEKPFSPADLADKIDKLLKS